MVRFFKRLYWSMRPITREEIIRDYEVGATWD